MIGILLALFSAMSFSINNILSKKLSQKVGVIPGLIQIYFFTSILSAILFLLFGQFNHIWNFQIISTIFVGGFFGAIGIIVLLKSFEKLPVGETLAIANTYSFFTLFLFWIFLNQTISLFQILIMFIVFIGIILTLTTKNFKLQINKNILFPFITAFSWGVYYFILNILSEYGVSNFNILFYIETLIFLFILFYEILIKKVKFSKKTYDLKNIYLSFFAGLTSMLGVLFFIFSFKNINASISASIVSSQIIFTTIIAYFIFKEKISKIQMLGIFIVFVGIVLFKLTS